MKNIKTKNFTLALLFIIGASALALGLPSSAQTVPELLLTWQAENYAPSGYQGRILPIRRSRISASVALIEGGKFTDISKNEIRWLVDNNLFKSGIGLQALEFPVPEIAAGQVRLKAVIMGFRGQNLEKPITIPVAEPEIVIAAPYPDRKIPAGLNIFRAGLYFFNISRANQLLFSWSANGAKTEGESAAPDQLELDASQGQSGDGVDLSVAVANALNPLEFANQSLKLTIK